MTGVTSSPALGSLAEISATATTPEVAMLLETADKMFQRSESVKRFRACRGSVETAKKLGIWSALSDVGLMGMCAPARLGGSEIDLRAGIFLAEVAGRRLAPEPFIACCFFPTAFLNLVEHPLADQLLSDMAGGIAMPAMAVDDCEPERSDVIVSIAGAKVTISGARRFVHGSAWATHFIVSAVMDKKTCVLIVPANSEGLRVGHIELADGSHSATLQFDNVAIDSGQIIAAGLDCHSKVSKAVDWARVAISAELFGVQTTLFGMTLEYLKVRKQFDRPIGSFQALQHRAVNLYCRKEIARYVIAEAADGIAFPSTPLSRMLLVSRCKARSADSAMQIGRESVQMHGAIGFSDECDVGLYLKRMLVLSAWLGGQDYHRRRFARLSRSVAG